MGRSLNCSLGKQLYLCHSVQRCQGRPGLPHRRFLEYRWRELQQGDPVCHEHDWSLWRHQPQWHAGALRLHTLQPLKDYFFNYAYSIFISLSQVSLVQYSDDAKTEFKLNTYYNKGIVISALKSVRYRGGNTKTGAPLRKKKKKTQPTLLFF